MINSPHGPLILNLEPYLCFILALPAVTMLIGLTPRYIIIALIGPTSPRIVRKYDC